ncbi:hypothetical protein CLOP_g23313 [Closterium sp. NIES-67]|nr:hypothetical protein CLOP_g23313 [Closterium sp. NIES-67]
MATSSLIACSAQAASSCLAARCTAIDAARISPTGLVSLAAGVTPARSTQPLPARQWVRSFQAGARRTGRSNDKRRRGFLVPTAATGSAAGAGDTDGSDSIEGRKQAGNPKAVDPEVLEGGIEGKTGSSSRDADVASGADVAEGADVAGSSDLDLEALARELNMDLKEVQEAERMFESAMSAVASLESLSATFDQMVLDSSDSGNSSKGLRGVLDSGGLETAGLDRGMEEMLKGIEAVSRGERRGISQSGEVNADEVDDDDDDVDLAGEAIADMERDLAELQRSVASTLAELDRTATSLTPELGLQEVLQLKSSISADVQQIEQQTAGILGMLREARQLQMAAEQPGAPVGARQLAAQRAVEARNAMAAMAGSAEAAAEALKALEEEGAADWDGVGGVKGEGIRRAGEEVRRRREEGKGGEEETDEDDDQPAYLPQWHELAAERSELKRELAEMFSNAVQLFQEGDEEGSLALVAANEAEVMGQQRRAAVPGGRRGGVSGAGGCKRGGSHGAGEGEWGGWNELAEMFSNAVQLFQEGDEEGSLALVAANEAEVMGQMFSNAVQLFQEGDEEGSLALVAANEAEVMGQVAGGEAGVEQAAVLLALSQLLLGMGHEERGRELMNQALSLVASHPAEPLLDDLLENAGDMCYGMDMWDDSIKLYKRAVNVQRELAGGEHYLQSSTLCSLANALAEAQRFEEAESVQRRAAELYEAARGERSRGVATMLVRLTQIQMEGGKVEEAEGSILRAKDILVEKEGLTSMEAAIVEFTLAQVRQAQGRPDLAAGVLESGLRIFEEAVEKQRRMGSRPANAELPGGADEPAWGDDELAGTPRALVNALGASAFPAFEQAQIELSMLYDILDRDEDACAIREKLLSAKELAVGPLSPALVPPLIQLAQSRMTTGQSEGAERLLRRALQIARSAVPAGDARLAVPIERLALCLAQMERLEEAEGLAREHVMIAEGVVEKAGTRGDTVELLAQGQRNLALILMATGRAEAAEQLLRKALARMEAAVGPMGDAALVVAGSLVVNLQQQGRDDEAEPLLKRLALAEAAATGNL